MLRGSVVKERESRPIHPARARCDTQVVPTLLETPRIRCRARLAGDDNQGKRYRPGESVTRVSATLSTLSRE
jgi:hypothetical protein